MPCYTLLAYYYCVIEGALPQRIEGPGCPSRCLPFAAQYSSGSSNVVIDRSASVMIHSV